MDIRHYTTESLDDFASVLSPKGIIFNRWIPSFTGMPMGNSTFLSEAQYFEAGTLHVLYEEIDLDNYRMHSSNAKKIGDKVRKMNIFNGHSGYMEEGSFYGDQIYVAVSQIYSPNLQIMPKLEQRLGIAKLQSSFALRTFESWLTVAKAARQTVALCEGYAVIMSDKRMCHMLNMNGQSDIVPSTVMVRLGGYPVQEIGRPTLKPYLTSRTFDTISPVLT
jgi:hypothetical protein